MKSLMKQLRLFFPFVFPLYITIPSPPEGLFESLLPNEEVDAVEKQLKKELGELHDMEKKLARLEGRSEAIGQMLGSFSRYHRR